MSILNAQGQAINPATGQPLGSVAFESMEREVLALRQVAQNVERQASAALSNQAGIMAALVMRMSGAKGNRIHLTPAQLKAIPKNCQVHVKPDDKGGLWVVVDGGSAVVSAECGTDEGADNAPEATTAVEDGPK